VTGPERRVAEYAATLSYSELTHEAVHAAKDVVFELLTRQTANWLGEVSKIARDYGYLSESHLGATIVGTRVHISAEVAAFVNTLQAVDESGTSVLDSVPALFALAELTGRSGQDLILGIVVAYDVASASPNPFVAGVAGSGALLGLDPDTIELALRFGAVPASGGFEAATTSRDIVTACCLAQMGIGGAAIPDLPDAVELPIPRVSHAVEAAASEAGARRFAEAAQDVLRPIQIESVLHLVETLDELDSLTEIFDCLVV
jgi:2-methylcitrate dehydratase PrpD